jgi:hypothetical protein
MATPEPLAIVCTSTYFDQHGRMVRHNELVVNEGTDGKVVEFIGRGVIAVDRPHEPAMAGNELTWVTEQHETDFPIPVPPAVGKSRAEFLGRLKMAFRLFDDALEAKEVRTKQEVRDFVAQQEKLNAAIKEAEAKAAPAPSNLILPNGAPAAGGKLIVPGGQPERLIQRGQESSQP